MLTMTDKAAEAIRMLASWERHWDGVRLSRDPAGRLMACAARGPMQGDQALAKAGARLYLERPLVSALDHGLVHVAAPVGARVCDTGIRALPQVTETVDAKDAAARTLTYEATAGNGGSVPRRGR